MLSPDNPPSFLDHLTGHSWIAEVIACSRAFQQEFLDNAKLLRTLLFTVQILIRSFSICAAYEFRLNHSSLQLKSNFGIPGKIYCEFTLCLEIIGRVNYTSHDSDSTAFAH